MTGWIGGDTEQMRELGRVVGEQAELLRGAVVRLGRSVQLISWQGGDLDDFAASWTARHAVELLAAAAVLTAQQAVLDANAADQDRTSADTGTGTGASGGILLPPGKAVGPRVNGPALADDFRDALATGDPVALQRWWESLSDREVAELIRQNPGLVLSLQQYGFLDPDERAAAYDAWLADVQSDSVVAGQSWSVEGGIAVPVYKILSVDLAADVGLDLLEMGDGSYQVVVNGGGALGVSVGDADGLLGAGLQSGPDGDLTYRFETREEADAFMAALAGAALPDDPLDAILLGGSLVASGMPGMGVTPLSAYAAKELGEVLGQNVANLESVTGGATLEVGGSAVAASLSSGVGASTTWNVQDGTATVTLGRTDQVSGALPLVGSSEFAAQVTLDPSGQETSLQVTGDAQLLFGQSLGPIPNGGAASGSITVDLTDPRNGAAAQQLAQAVASGDTAGAQAAVAQLYQSSAVVFQGDLLHGTQAELSLEVVSGGYSYTESDRLGLWVKPPGSTEYGQVG